MFCAWTWCHLCLVHTGVKIVFLRQLEGHLAFMQCDRHAVLVWIRSCFTCCSWAGAWKSVPFCQDCNWFNLTLPSVSGWRSLPGSWMVRRELQRFLLVSGGERRIQTEGCCNQTNVSWFFFFLCVLFALIAANVGFLPVLRFWSFAFFVRV